MFVGKLLNLLDSALDNATGRYDPDADTAVDGSESSSSQLQQQQQQRQQEEQAEHAGDDDVAVLTPAEAEAAKQAAKREAWARRQQQQVARSPAPQVAANIVPAPAAYGPADAAAAPANSISSAIAAAEPSAAAAQAYTPPPVAAPLRTASPDASSAAPGVAEQIAAVRQSAMQQPRHQRSHTEPASRGEGVVPSPAIAAAPSPLRASAGEQQVSAREASAATAAAEQQRRQATPADTVQRAATSTLTGGSEQQARQQQQRPGGSAAAAPAAAAAAGAGLQQQQQRSSADAAAHDAAARAAAAAARRDLEERAARDIADAIKRAERARREAMAAAELRRSGGERERRQAAAGKAAGAVEERRAATAAAAAGVEERATEQRRAAAAAAAAGSSTRSASAAAVAVAHSVPSTQSPAEVGAAAAAQQTAATAAESSPTRAELAAAAAAILPALAGPRAAPPARAAAPAAATSAAALMGAAPLLPVTTAYLSTDDKALLRAEAWAKARVEIDSKAAAAAATAGGPAGAGEGAAGGVAGRAGSPVLRRKASVVAVPPGECIPKVGALNPGPHAFAKLQQQSGTPPPECCACAGLWDEGGTAVSHYYRCAACSAVVHGACREFYQGSSACAPRARGAALTPPPPLPPLLNCAGVVRVRVMQAYQLPLAPGDVVYAMLQLLPWKERAKTDSAPWGDMGAIWAPPAPPPTAGGGGEGGSGSAAGGDGALEMLHLENSEAPPVPVLRVELWRRALKIMDELLGAVELWRRALKIMDELLGAVELWRRALKIMDELLAAVQVSAAPLMRRPGARAERWHALQPPSRGTLLLSLQFVPRAVPARLLLSDGTLAAAAAAPPLSPSSGAGHAQERPLPPPPAAATSASAAEASRRRSGDAAAAEGVHLFRLRSYARLTWCGVCGGALLGVYGQGFRCEACGMDVHERCQMRANFSTRLTLMPAAPATSNTALIGGGDDDERSRLTTGVGTIEIALRSAHRCGAGCAPDGTSHDMGSGEPVILSDAISDSSKHHRARLSNAAAAAGSSGGGSGSGGSGGGSRHQRLSSASVAGAAGGGGGAGGVAGGGNHYCRVRVIARGGAPPELGTQERRTRTVFQTANPLFNAAWSLVAPAYDSAVEVELRDAASDRAVGAFDATVFELVQRDADAAVARRHPLPSETASWRGLRDSRTGRVVGLLKLQVAFLEDGEGLMWGPRPRAAPSRALDDLTVETLKRYIERAQGIVGWLSAWGRVYSRVMSWESPLLTGAALALFLYLTLLSSAEYVLAGPPFALLAYMGHAWLARRDGRYVRCWPHFAGAGPRVGLGPSDKSAAADAQGVEGRVDDKSAGADAQGYRPLAQLRVAVLRGRNLVSEDLGLPGNAYVRVTYAPAAVGGVGAGGGGGGTGALTADGAAGAKRGAAPEFTVGETAPLEGARPDPEWRALAPWGGGRGGGGGDNVLLQNVTEAWPRGGDDTGEDAALLYPLLEPRSAEGEYFEFKVWDDLG
ncbi:hypothetical protein JKP88DRAFT_288633 [Tribonema minus]|uniref:Phorbol-ester/DAG-type domain-containing protein n=1 Tax=Tribonema minus TaxID=303371 RepID=A0A835ZCX8_9STRA|nr:hypothetical protein JKP88DRAFT_288633 [Tribonema minus]